LAIALLALAVRLAQLGERPMHTDESVNAYLTGDLLAGEAFRYDPQDRHGPALFVLAEPLARLLGAKQFSDLTETQLRLGPVLAGTAAILLCGAAVEMFGLVACVVAAVLLAFAPLPLYYGRYFIHETLFVAATFGLILSGWHAVKGHSAPAAATAGLCAGLMFTCKETAVIHFFALGAAGAICWFLPPPGRPLNRLGLLKPGLIAALVFLCASVLLFTWFGRNWRALEDLLRAIPNFAARAGGEGHQKPFWYYAALLGGGWSGAALMTVAAAGGLRVLLQARSELSGPRGFLVIYALLIAGIYSAIPYKTPWLALNCWLPLSLLAGLAVEWIWSSAKNSHARAIVLTCALALGVLTAHDSWSRVFADPAGERNPYAYAHTVEDLLRLPPRLEQLARENHLGQPLIAVVAADPWPLPWYLRHFSRVGFWQPGQDPGPADFYITSPAAAANLGDRLKDFRPEYFGVRPEALIILWLPEPADARPGNARIHGFNQYAMVTPFQAPVADQGNSHAVPSARQSANRAWPLRADYFLAP